MRKKGWRFNRSPVVLQNHRLRQFIMKREKFSTFCTWKSFNLWNKGPFPKSQGSKQLLKINYWVCTKMHEIHLCDQKLHRQKRMLVCGTTWNTLVPSRLLNSHWKSALKYETFLKFWHSVAICLSLLLIKSFKFDKVPNLQGLLHCASHEPEKEQNDILEETW